MFLLICQRENESLSLRLALYIFKKLRLALWQNVCVVIGKSCTLANDSLIWLYCSTVKLSPLRTAIEFDFWWGNMKHLKVVSAAICFKCLFYGVLVRTEAKK